MVRPVVNPKKGLVFTARATRLFSFNILAMSSVLITALLIDVQGAKLLITTAGCVFFVPLFLPLSGIVVYPLEAFINFLYLRDAKKKLESIGPKVIAITGSYGKTGTKDILTSILGLKFKVLKTPGSFNTPMGICKVIRNDLREDHEIFVVETGAKEKGDIRELCRLVKPEIGIITSIGPQHLETFKTMENIVNTKYELIESLPEGGVAIFNNDNPYCRELANKTFHTKVLRYGMDEGAEKLFVKALDIITDSEGISFSAMNGAAHSVRVKAPLLGRHNISNILAASVAAVSMGMSLNNIAGVTGKLRSSAHRLSLMHGAGGITVIDDAFNSNPVGAKAALEVLGEFKGGRKILVTPGFVEMGDREYEANKYLGLLAAEVCDMVFLVGPKKTTPILEGLREGGFDDTNVFVEISLDDVTRKFKGLLIPGDVVLFENDLPDNYNE